VALISLTIALLLLPKVMGVVVAIMHRKAAFGGSWAIIKGAFIETLFAILIAPVMMAFHAYFVISVFLGFKVNWDAQEREGRLMPWREALARTWRTTATALAWGAVTFYFTPIFFWWLMPILTGLVLSAPIARYSSSLTFGKWARRNNIFICPSETDIDPALQFLQQPPPERIPLPEPATAPALPMDVWVDMPEQSLRKIPAQAFEATT
jgi:membrane glycosyltransferase